MTHDPNSPLGIVQGLREHPLECVSIRVNAGDANQLDVTIRPVQNSSPFAGGTFKIKILIPPGFPHSEPQIRFETQIYHPNIDESGQLAFESTWTSTSSIRSLLAELHRLLLDPNLENAQAPEVAHMWKRDFYLARDIAREWTAAYAQSDDGGHTDY